MLILFAHVLSLDSPQPTKRQHGFTSHAAVAACTVRVQYIYAHLTPHANIACMPTIDNSDVTVRVTLPPDVLKSYETLATVQSKPLEDVLAQQLARFRTIDSTKPLILSDAERQQVEKILGRNLTTSTDLVLVLQRALAVNIDGVDIPLTPFLLDRLKSRCIGMEFGKFMQITVKRLLEEFVGVR